MLSAMPPRITEPVTGSAAGPPGGGFASPAVRQQRASKAIARKPSSAATAPARYKVCGQTNSRMRDRCVQPRISRGTLGCAETLHLPDLFLHIFQGTCSIEVERDTPALFLQQFSVARLVKRRRPTNPDQQPARPRSPTNRGKLCCFAASQERATSRNRDEPEDLLQDRPASSA